MLKTPPGVCEASLLRALPVTMELTQPRRGGGGGGGGLGCAVPRCRHIGCVVSHGAAAVSCCVVLCYAVLCCVGICLFDFCLCTSLVSPMSLVPP